MWQPYIDVIMANASNATLVFDKFHMVRHLMEAVDEVRRQEINEKGKSHRDLVGDPLATGADEEVRLAGSAA